MTAVRKRVLLTEPIHAAGMELLGRDFDVRVAADPSVQGLLREAREASGMLVRAARVPAAVIEAAPRLEVIARHGVGFDNIDVAAATRRRIPVAVTADANKVSVAEHALALMSAIAKRLLPYDAATRAGDWRIRHSYAPFDLEGKTLGVVGVGRVGGLVARKARAAFDMRVLGYDRYLPDEAVARTGAEPVASLDDMLAAVDVLTVHVPLTPETRGMIGTGELARLKPSAVVINTARGGIVDEVALHDALAGGRLLAAGLDVFVEEPAPPGNPLFALPNVVVTPHSAAATAEGVYRMSTAAARAIVDTLRGGRPAHVVNPEVFD